LILSIDAMGGDSGAATILAGCALARRRHPHLRFLLHGDEAVLKPLLVHRKILSQACEIRHAPAVVAMAEKPSQALRRGRNTSMWHAIEAVAAGECPVAVSAGNTGALMAISMFRIGLIEGISRPAIAVLWPTQRGQSIVLDVGANAGSDAQQLVDFAVMGEAFARAIFGIERPTVGLLNIGEEEMKGIESVKRAGQILRACQLPMEFCGFIEGDRIGEGAVDVVVTDGFTGNVALKAIEGAAGFATEQMRSVLQGSRSARFGTVFQRRALRELGGRMDAETYGGAALLGLEGTIVIAHGSSTAKGITSACRLAADLARGQITEKIRERLGPHRGAHFLRRP
jgi:glycerol-3-phosphate acyltransferase PlsX